MVPADSRSERATTVLRNGRYGRGCAGWLSGWRDFHEEAEEYRELDGERVFVLFHLGARGKTSGLDVGQIRTEGASVFHVRGGKVARLVQYFERERALADVGLAPQAASPDS